MIKRLIFPPRCPLCEEVLELSLTGTTPNLCPECEEKIKPFFVEEPICKKCGKPIRKETEEYCGDCKRKNHTFHSGKSVLLYEKEVKEMMYRYKYANKRCYAPFLAELLAEQHKTWLSYIQPDVIIPIPLHPKRRRMRGYNQAELLAKELSRITGIPVDAKYLYRVKNTEPLKQLSAQNRKKDMKNAFLVKGNRVQLKKVLLVDDIYTTGSTMDEATIAIKRVSDAEVYCMTVCIGRGDEVEA